MLRKPGLAGLLDPSNYQGVRLWVRGNGERYSVHLRTCRTWLPWQFFYTTFDTSDQWRQVDLPFGEFKSESFTLGAKLRPSRLKTLAIVAIKKAFEADLAASRIDLYR